jgi:hypothetical protein
MDGVILTPEQMDEFVELTRETGYIDICSYEYDGDINSDDIADTLAAYAEIVQKVAEVQVLVDAVHFHGSAQMSVCPFCGNYTDPEKDMEDIKHSPDCLYLVARKLRGLK